MPGNKVFSVVIFFIAFREALEAALVIGTLMGMLESLARHVLPDRNTPTSTITDSPSTDQGGTTGAVDLEIDTERVKERRILIKQMRKTVLYGAGSGLALAFVIGAAFLAVFYTQANDLYGKAEEAWEAAFCLLALLLITPMALAILRADRSRKKWQLKLKNAFAGKLSSEDAQHDPAAAAAHMAGVDPTGKQPQETPTDEIKESDDTSNKGEQQTMPQLQHSETKSSASPRPSLLQRVVAKVKQPFLKANRGRTTIFTVPFITTLREGLEGVVFIGGVSLGLPATSIPLPAIIGIACGLAIGAFVFKAGSFAKIRIFLLFSTCILLIIAAGMATRAVYYLEFYRYVRKVGDAAAESGSGPGSYDALNYIWHIDCCNPEDTSSGSGYGILNGLVGWNNTGTAGSIASYIVYWVVIVAYLVYAMWKENRLALAWRKKGGSRVVLWESKRAKSARQRREARIQHRLH